MNMWAEMKPFKENVFFVSILNNAVLSVFNMQYLQMLMSSFK